jgi:phospholipid/cholesterol/gamma-HCH transport system ATP-binding protein
MFNRENAAIRQAMPRGYDLNVQEPSHPDVPPAGEVTPAAQPVEIQVEDLHKAFGANQVLRGIDLVIRRGEIVAIVGVSGGGKTVLLKHLIGRLQPDRGRVLVADHESPGSPLVDLATLNEPEMDRLRRHWAVVFQKNALFTGTVQDNISLALTEVKGLEAGEVEDRVREAIKSVGLDPDQAPQLDRDELSGGMAKRVALARAVALDPVLIFYDEPTTGLDPERGQQIQDLVRDIHHRRPALGIERTTIIITHDAGLLFRLKPRVIMLHEGKVGFDGTAEEFENSDKPYIEPYIDLMPILHGRMRSR